MTGRFKRTVSIIAAAAVFFAFSAMIEPAEAASKTVNVKVSVKYGQTEARSMFKMVNDFRTGPGAWYWDKTNTKKIRCNSLRKLKYDYKLEKVAMQRAAELAVSYAHERPDGTSCFSAYSEAKLNCSAAGENIAVTNATSRTADFIFTGWKEDEYDYSGQGHRRNMLSGDFTAIGIGHAEFNGKHFWVQEFMNPATEAPKSAAANAGKSVTVKVAKDRILKSSIKPAKKKYTVTSGSTLSLAPMFTTKIQAVSYLPTSHPLAGASPVTVPRTYTLSNRKVASISGNRLTAKKAGTVKLTAKVSLDRTKSASLTVKVLPAQKISARSYKKVYGSRAFNLKAKARGRLSYSSGNTRVARVNSKGTVSIKGTGQATITIKAAATGKYGVTTKKVTVTVVPKRVSSLKLSGGAKKLKASWKPVAKASGYQIIYAQNSKFTKGRKSVYVKGKTSKATVGKLKPKRTYYVKVRAYKTSGKTKVYGSCSPVKKVKTN